MSPLPLLSPPLFSSLNFQVRTIFNWQHTDPVLLCNDLSTYREAVHSSTATTTQHIPRALTESSGHQSMSVKEAVRIAQSNNFMGLVCSSRLLVCAIPHLPTPPPPSSSSSSPSPFPSPNPSPVHPYTPSPLSSPTQPIPNLFSEHKTTTNANPNPAADGPHPNQQHQNRRPSPRNRYLGGAFEGGVFDGCICCCDGISDAGGGRWAGGRWRAPREWCATVL